MTTSVPFHLLLTKKATNFNSVNLLGIVLINFNQGAAVTDSTSHAEPEPRTWASLLDTFQDFLITEHMKPRMHMLEISISSINHVIVRPTKTPKSADKKCA